MVRLLYTQPIFFFFNATATTGIYTLSLHDALPILPGFGNLLRKTAFAQTAADLAAISCALERYRLARGQYPDRKSTRLNSSHVSISYAVFCLKKKNTEKVNVLSS